MLLQENRLRKMKDFDILWKEGRFVTGTLANAKVWQLQPEKYPRRAYTAADLRFGFVVSTKISKSAVKRNRIKRQMREVVRLLLKDGRIKFGFHIAIIAKSEMLGKEYEEIERSLAELLRRSGVMIELKGIKQN